ncbi:MAG: sugar transferase [Lachnospiraceae bacterium]|nr:sugar transferase [Lachnospiraceae bacterium]
MYQRRSNIQDIFLLFVDSVCVTIGLILANYIRHGSFFGMPRDDMSFSVLWGLCIVVFLICNLMFRINRDFYVRGPFHELIVALENSILIFVGVTVILFFLKRNASSSRLMLVYFIVIDSLLITLVHQIIKALLPGMYHRFMDRTRMLLVTDKELAESAIADVRGFADFSQELIGVTLLDVEGREEIEGLPVVAGIDDLTEYCKKGSLDEVVIAVGDHDKDLSDRLLKVMEDIAQMGMIIHYRITLPDLNGARHKMLLRRGNMYTVTYANQVTSMGQVVVKRVMDIVGGLIGCIIAAVLYIILGPIIKLQSPGPVIFSQKRVGRNGRVFNMYKFRSMYEDAEERKKDLKELNEMRGLMFKMDNDPRITPIGRFMRRTSLDEWPQFYNILRGDMSLVGTRPPTIDEFSEYSYYHKKRLSFRPGLTGMWQVSGRNEITDFDEIVRLDVEYIDNWTLLLDIKILLKTLGVIFKGK